MNFIADGAMDNYPTYELLKHYDILPFISPDSRTKAKFNYEHLVFFAWIKYLKFSLLATLEQAT